MDEQPKTRPNELVEVLRPFWSAARTSKALGLTESRLLLEVAGGRVLGLGTSDNMMVFPVWQFTSEPGHAVRVWPGVQAFCEGLKDQDPWSVALLLRSHHRVPELGGRTPLEAVEAGDDDSLRAYAHQVWREWRP
jgi:hypothetical protein